MPTGRRPPTRRNGEGEYEPSRPFEISQGERELVVVVSGDAAVRVTRDGLAARESAEVGSLTALLQDEGATLRPLFGVPEERLKHEAAMMAVTRGVDLPDLSVYYRVEAPEDRLDRLTERLREHPVVQTAFIKPPAALPQDLNDMQPTAEEAPPATPDFTPRQSYLDVAPGGIDARFAWTIPGGGGAGIRIIDIEGAWRFTHEDLTQNQGGVVGGTPNSDVAWRNHGTAVVGEFGGDRNSAGVTGICPDANVRAISIFGGLGSAAAIRQAANMLNPGDVILIELHRPGPQFGFASPQGQRGYIAVEWWPDDFDAIRYATGHGIIVVEAAGNGSENLDDAIYDTNPGPPYGPFPASWRNPFRRNPVDSGAVIVGAGAPPPGTHGRDHGPDRSRLAFSNFGAAVDAQGWGREVTSCGYGDLQGGASEDLWYTDQFSGTSSASPMVVGAVACVQGVLQARSASPLLPAAVRNLVRTTGSPQQDAPGRLQTERIGNRPNLREMITRFVGVATVPLHRYWNPTIGDYFYTTNLGELGSGGTGWIAEGIQCYVYPLPVGASVPLYRYWNPTIADHVYTTDWNELGAGRYGWFYEGIQCYVFPQPRPGTVALHRYWNPALGGHFYTTNWNELGAGRYGWFYEGVQCHVHSQPVVSSPADEPKPQSTKS